MTLSVARVTEMLNDLDDYELRWTEWETQFLNSLKEKLEEDGKIKLSDKQIESLQKIYDKYLVKPV